MLFLNLYSSTIYTPNSNLRYIELAKQQLKMEERSAIKLYYDKGYKTADIVKALKEFNIGKRKIYRTVERIRETGSIADRKRSGRPRSVSTPQLINKVKSHLWRNPKQSIRKMAPLLNASRRTMSRVVKEDLGLRAYKTRKDQGLTKNQMSKILQRSKALLEWFANENMDTVVFSDEKFF
jgi:transposase